VCQGECTDGDRTYSAWAIKCLVQLVRSRQRPGDEPPGAEASLPCDAPDARRETQAVLTFLNGRLRTGLPVAAKIAFMTAGETTQMVGSPTPPQKS